jgi:hypothetical protein
LYTFLTFRFFPSADDLPLLSRLLRVRLLHVSPLHVHPLQVHPLQGHPLQGHPLLVRSPVIMPLLVRPRLARTVQTLLTLLFRRRNPAPRRRSPSRAGNFGCPSRWPEAACAKR